MRSNTGMTVLTLSLVLLALGAATALAGDLDGTIKVGGIFVDEKDGSDLSVMQETWNLYDGFNVAQVKLNSHLGGKHFLKLDVEEANLDSRSGRIGYYLTDLFELTARYDRYRMLYDMDGSTESERENWRFGGKLTPTDWLRITGNYGLQTREGARMGEPVGPGGFLGSTYDYDLQTGFFEAEARSGARAFAVGYEMSRFTDNELALADRKGDIVSARLSLPCYFMPDRLSHFVRGSYGKQQMQEIDTQYELSTFQYLGIYKPARAWQLKYRFFFSRVDNEVTRLKTDNVRNDADLVWYHDHGSVFGGYGYVTNDDDRTLTENTVWRLGTNYRYENWVKAKISYASSEKSDQENLTLLKDIETSRLKASLRSQPLDDLTLGVGYTDRVREFTVIDVKATGKRYSAFGAYDLTGLGKLQVDFAFADEEYIDTAGGFDAEHYTATGRFDFTKVKDLRLSIMGTYLDMGGDLDTEKSILGFEGEYAFKDDWFLEAKYNAYNYDDYILIDRYYEANVIWVNLGYNLSIK